MIYVGLRFGEPSLIIGRVQNEICNLFIHRQGERWTGLVTVLCLTLFRLGGGVKTTPPGEKIK